MKFKTIILASILSISTFVVSYKYRDLNHNFANTKEVQEIETNLILVNKENPLDSSYKPSNLVKPNIPFVDSANDDEKFMKSESAKAIEELFNS
ncbi:hypothetical protein ACQPUZ_21015, partial [Clostridium tertium]